MLLLAQIEPTSYIFNLSQLILFQQALKYKSVPAQLCYCTKFLLFSTFACCGKSKYLSAGSYVKETYLKLDSTHINGPNRKIPAS